MYIPVYHTNRLSIKNAIGMVRKWVWPFEPHIHTVFVGLAVESALESADSSSESADSNADAPVGM